MARYFLTGATGFIGGRLARQLREAGHEVVALARDPARAAGLEALGVDVRPGDITRPETLRPAMEGADGVFHVAGWYEVGLPDTSPGWRINVQGTRNVLQAMAGAKIPKGVYTSTLAVFSDTGGRLVDEGYRHDGPWLSEYDRTKWVAHYQVAEPMMARGLPLVIVQPGVTYGPGDSGPFRPFFVRYLRRRLLFLPRGTAYCWAHVEDTARAHLEAMERGRPGESYIIAGPPCTLLALFRLAQEITGIPAPRVEVPGGLVRAAAALIRLLEAILPVPPSYASEALRSAAGVTYLGSSAKAERELGFRPRPLREGLGETLEHEMRLLAAGG